VTAVWVALAALTVALTVAWRAACYRRDLRDQAWADEWIKVLRSMRSVDFDEHAAQALYVVADDLERRRIDAAIRRHPAGGAR
jgi:hypothetical protein